ncbi:LPP20 family lipoprotein [Marinospirillum alkaliphilum]|uniref:Lipoprotein LPP20-like domain-containing protein n=1 Tax=Marinospirillum alkaliphilum DSM 21637 TaxID=1122209 RepID=A0A1K1VHG7_9GAMM|nr:LPP20 family lipoprotein [Marinospirillum alkaliphilum]SFX24617.1 hypothetical protein SAMN02745752_00989 [Marinospirillum alkaliphilum DSM 21637]
MIKKILFAGSMVLALTLTTGCASKKQEQSAPQAQTFTNLEVVIIRVNGYGTAGEENVQLNATQRRLLAMRASKIDAYRSLAERVNGTRIQGVTTVNNLATTDDSIRAFVDSLIRDARVANVRELSDGSFETQLELVLEPEVQRCMLEGEADNPICRPATVSSSSQPSQQGRNTRYHLD